MFHRNSKSYILRKMEKGVQKLQSTHGDSTFCIENLNLVFGKVNHENKDDEHFCLNSERNTSTNNSDNKVLPLQDLLRCFGDISIRRFAPDKNCPLVRVRVCIRVRVTFRVGGQFSWGTILLEPYQSIRCKNLLLIEVYIYIHALSPEIMNQGFFTRSNIFDTRFIIFNLMFSKLTYLPQRNMD